eukprot:7387433-Prymnesium_polylepis.2
MGKMSLVASRRSKSSKNGAAAISRRGRSNGTFSGLRSFPTLHLCDARGQDWRRLAGQRMPLVRSAAACGAGAWRWGRGGLAGAPAKQRALKALRHDRLVQRRLGLEECTYRGEHRRQGERAPVVHSASDARQLGHRARPADADQPLCEVGHEHDCRPDDVDDVDDHLLVGEQHQLRV